MILRDYGRVAGDCGDMVKQCLMGAFQKIAPNLKMWANVIVWFKPSAASM